MTGTKSLLQFSYNEVENAYLDGRVPRRVFRQYCTITDWIHPRVGDVSGDKQYEWAKRHGQIFAIRRMNRVRKVLGLHLYKEVGPPVRGFLCS